MKKPANQQFKGMVIDEKALYEVLKEGRIAGATLDVFEQEPTRANYLDDKDIVWILA